MLTRVVTSVGGLSDRESWGRWSDAHRADSIKICFRSPLPLKGTISVTAKSFGPNSGCPTAIRLGGFTTEMCFADDNTTVKSEYEIPFPVDMLEIIPSRSASPKELGLSNDERRLGIGIAKLIITPDVEISDESQLGMPDFRVVSKPQDNKAGEILKGSAVVSAAR